VKARHFDARAPTPLQVDCPKRAEFEGIRAMARKVLLLSARMIIVRRNEARQHHVRGRHEAWLTFPSVGIPDPLAGGLESLEFLNEDRLAPASAIASQPPHDAEILTYVREGAIAFQDSTGRSRVIQAGEFHRVAPGQTVRHRASNASRTENAHVFQIWLRAPPGGLEPGQDQMRFSAAERRGWLFLVASPDGRRGSLRIQPDVLVYSALLESGQHLVHDLAPGRRAWLHVVDGSVTLDDLVLTKGDGVGITAERAVSVTSRSPAEFLLLNLADAESPSRPDNVELAEKPPRLATNEDKTKRGATSVVTS
jgi:quercetin 2,3-dioxygenase